MSGSVFFDGWPGLLRVLVVGTAAYLSLIVILRSSGKRTLAKLSAFDLVVTVALGSTLATVLLSGDVALVEGVLAMVLLAVLQLVVTFASVRVRWFAGFVRSNPVLLYRDGFLLDVMRRERVTKNELRQAGRTGGHASLDTVGAIVLESDGSFSILDAAPVRVDSDE